jgi:predicted acyltransferase (DUF342 family)
MRALAAALLMAAAGAAGAANYVFPGTLPPGCSGSGPSYTCTALSLGYGDTLTINAPKPATITVNGALDTNTSQINAAGSASDLTLVVTGTLTLGYQALIRANVTAGAVSDPNGASTFGGSLATTSGNITLGYASTVAGSVSSTSGAISIAQNGTVGGSITSTSGAITVPYQARVTGSVSTTGTVTIGQEAVVSGGISGGSGLVDIGYGARVAGPVLSSGAITLAQASVASACVRSSSAAAITLGYQSSVNSVCCGNTCSSSCVVNNSTYATPPLCTGIAPALDHVEAVPASTSALTCSSASVTLKACANAACTTLLASYTGTVNLSTGTGRGDWSAGSAPAPQGTLSNGSANDGAASYTFVAGDAGSAKLLLTHTLAQDVTVTAVDSASPSTARTSSAIQFRDNGFVFSEDASNRIAGSDLAVAGRPHDLRLTLVKRDPATGSCGTVTDYSGSRSLKLWRSDSGGSWTAPAVVSPALSVPAAQPVANNLTLAFSAGVAGFNLGTTDIGRYALNALDDSLTLAATAVSGGSNALTVRPFALVVHNIVQGATPNPAGSAATDAVFARAGSSFQASVGAYRWSAAMTGNGTDANDDGLPDAGATLASTIAGGLAPSFASSVTLAPLAGSQTPAGGVLGTLAGGSVSGFTGGSATPAALQYSEVGSFALATTGVVSNFLGSGLALDATVFNAAGTPSTRIGRFVPARFALSAPTVTHRSSAACTPASTFTYLGETFRLGFTLTAQNAAGATTQNYTGAFAKLGLATPAAFNLAGIAGSTLFSTAGAAPRLALGTSTGSWSNGVASGITLSAAAQRGSAADGPFDAAFGIAPADSDGVQITSFDLDTDAPANGNERASIGTVALRFGRLRLGNAIGAQDRALTLPLAAQHWNGSAFDTNPLDSCTVVPASAVNFGNLRRTLTAADTAVSGGNVTLAGGLGRLLLAAPAAGHAGSVDIALSLGSTAADASCLQPWTPAAGDAATAGANLAFLRGAWCGTAFDKDPTARASFGLYRGADAVIHQRENY